MDSVLHFHLEWFCYLIKVMPQAQLHIDFYSHTNNYIDWLGSNLLVKVCHCTMTNKCNIEVAVTLIYLLMVINIGFAKWYITIKILPNLDRILLNLQFWGRIFLLQNLSNLQSGSNINWFWIIPSIWNEYLISRSLRVQFLLLVTKVKYCFLF